ncbi:MAG: hypothetical protein H7Y11_11225 [Armatimonadetes bacterium]|nr:hypothetical protein [Anaerolineae bacterium]
MQLPPIFLAHGLLGQWDELIFLGVGVLFFAMMGFSFIRSRDDDDLDDDNPEADLPAEPADNPTTQDADSERFPLR